MISPMKTRPINALLLCLVLAFASFAHAQAESPLDQAKAALARKDLAAAETLLATLVAAEKPDAAACHQLGVIRQRQGRFAEAIELFEKATSLDPTHAPYFSDLGMAASQRMAEVGMMRGAMLAMKMKKAWTTALELDPKNISSVIGLARYHTNAPEIAGGSMEKAREFAQRLKQLHPFLGELEFGIIAEHFEDFAAAVSHYEAAARLAPANPQPRTAAARVLTQLGRPAEARAHLEAALKANPSNEHAKAALAALPAVATTSAP